MHLTSPFKKKGDGGRGKRAKGEITTVRFCDNLSQRLSSNSEKPSMHLPLSLHTAVFHRGRAVPPDPPSRRWAERQQRALRSRRAGPMYQGGVTDVPGETGSHPALTLHRRFPRPVTSRNAAESRSSSFFRSSSSFADGLGKRGGRAVVLGGRVGRGWPLNADQPALQGSSGMAAAPPAPPLAGTPRLVPALGTRPSPGCCVPPHGRAFSSCSAVTQGMPSGWRRDISPHLLLTAFMHPTVSQGGEQEILAHQGGGFPWVWLD